MKIKDYKELIVWKRGLDIADDVYRLTSAFPREEMYGIVSQMRRSAVSISSNVAEGFVRRGSLEFRQFIRIALGSCAELETQCYLAKRVGYLKDDHFCNVVNSIQEEMKMLMSLSLKISDAGGLKK